MKKIKKIIAIYSSALIKNEKSNLQNIDKIKVNIKLSNDCLNRLRLEIRESNFASKEDEITFFKYQKPQLLGELNFFIGQFNFFSHLPKGNIPEQKKFIQKNLKKLEIKKKKKAAFFQYCQHDENSFDDKYFVRGNNQLYLFKYKINSLDDPQFSTSHDSWAADIVTYNLLTDFYLKELEYLRIKKSNFSFVEIKPEIFKNIFWTASKTDLIELLYALNASGAIQNGNAEIKKMSDVCNTLFNADFGNFYKTFGEIKARGKDTTKFLDKLKISLINKMDSEN